MDWERGSGIERIRVGVYRTLLAIQDGEWPPVNRNHADLPVVSVLPYYSFQGLPTWTPSK